MNPIPVKKPVIKPAETDDARAAASSAQRGHSGISVRCDVRAGQWQCRSCQGEVNGDRMFGPSCSYCRFV